MAKQYIGIIGLGVMGQNLALNIESQGFSVAGFDSDHAKTERLAQRTSGKKIFATKNLSEFVESLDCPRRVLMMVPAGRAVDSVIASLRPNLEAGDLLMDGGNTLFSDTKRRIEELQGTGILYLGVGVSGGEEGALHGPAMMPGGNEEAWPLIKPVLQAIAAKAEDGSPCCEWIGNGGAGHFVKMIHNGIEYADMQLICEAYWLMSRLLGMSASAISQVFAEWNRGELSSYLVAITADVLSKVDHETERPLVDLILDVAEQKGTGKWTSQVALELGVSAPTIAAAVFARTMSAAKQERVMAAKVLTGNSSTFSGDKVALIESIRKSLYVSKIGSYAQGFQLLRAADREYRFHLQYGIIASLWRAGCIIRAQFLERIKAAYENCPTLASLLLDPYFSAVLNDYQLAFREVVAVAAQNGVSVPAFMSALSYFDGYRSANSPANLLQGQRDYFGAHTYERVDRPGKFHTDWVSSELEQRR
jgi:6-phosphogluconate dehydrogenase